MDRLLCSNEHKFPSAEKKVRGDIIFCSLQSDQNSKKKKRILASYEA